MILTLVSVNPQRPQKRHIRRAAEIIRGGGIVVYPTDTVYGIGCDLNDRKAIRRLIVLKDRPKKKPFSVICLDFADVSRCAVVSNYAYKTMRRFLPGPYTFIVQASKEIPKLMVSKQRTVGIRMPDNPIVLELVQEFGGPLCTTSVVLEAEETVQDPEAFQEMLKDKVDLILDGGIAVSDHSTIVDLTVDPPSVLRKGKGDPSPFL
jgi:tRNA threonylcarbamoyl adenosine modification protein (Sua5/YciO/YrdC/YwlC family)